METDTSYIYLSNLNSLIQEKQNVNQRDVSKALQMSLGMANSILKRFAEKGWIFMHKINAKNIRYVLTPEGLNALAERGYTYIKRTMKSVVRYRDIFITVIADAKKIGCTCVILVGTTDLQFLIEYACEQNALQLKQVQTAEQAPKTTELLFFANTQDYKNCIALPNSSPWCVDIAQLFY